MKTLSEELKNIPVETMYKYLHRDYRALQKEYNELKQKYNSLIKGLVDVDSEEFQRIAKQHARKLRKEEIAILTAKVKKLEDELVYYKAKEMK